MATSWRIDDKPANTKRIIALAVAYGYQGHRGHMFVSEALDILRKNGHEVYPNQQYAG